MREGLGESDLFRHLGAVLERQWTQHLLHKAVFAQTDMQQTETSNEHAAGKQ